VQLTQAVEDVQDEQFVIVAEQLEHLFEDKY